MLVSIFTYLNKIKSKFIQYSVLIILLWGFDITVPYISGLYIDSLLEYAGYNNTFIIYIVLLAFLNFSKIFLQYLKVLLTTKINNTMFHQICNDIFQKIFRSNYKIYSNIDNAFYIDQINKDTNTIVYFISTNIVNFFCKVRQ